MTDRPPTAAVSVGDAPDRRRFEATVEGSLAGFAQYVRRPDRVVFTHTEVDPAFEGRGVGSALAKGALDAVRASGLGVEPLCPFIAAYIRRHPAYADLVVAQEIRERIVTADEPGPVALAPRGRHYASDAIEVWYDVRRCRHAAECVRGDAAVFDTGRKPSIGPDLGDPGHIAEVIRRCPTGALQYRVADGHEEAADRPTVITLRPDGALWVRGELLLETPDGVVAERRAALCGCGRSTSRPYCDGRCAAVSG